MTDNTQISWSLRPGRILIVDDLATERNLLCKLLERQGHEVLQASDGKEALHIAHTKAPDAILLDIMMPGIDGLEVCRRIKIDPVTSAIPVIIVTVLTDREHKLAGIEAGADDFLNKPVDTHELILRVRSAVRTKKLIDRTRADSNRLRRTEDLKDNLMHMMVHDMRAPLMVVKGYLDLLRDDAEEGLTEDERSEYLDEALVDTATLVRMTNTLYDISALENGTAQLDIDEHNLTPLAQAALCSLGPMRDNAQIEFDAPDDAVLAAVDATMIERMVANLLGHAFRHTPSDNVVRMTLADDVHQVTLTIQDGGVTIPAEERANVLVKFGQADAWKRKKVFAVGLSLAFAKLAVEAHGGSIDLTAPNDSGNLFTILLPKRPLKDTTQGNQ